MERTLEIFSDEWAFAVLQECFFGVRRFDEFQRHLDISRSVLTRRLNHLVKQKIIERRLYSSRPPRYEYRLTERGHDMYPIFVAFREWGERWLKIGKTPDLRLIHIPCKHDLHLRMSCEHCGQVLHARDVRYEWLGKVSG